MKGCEMSLMALLLLRRGVHEYRRHVDRGAVTVIGIFCLSVEWLGISARQTDSYRTDGTALLPYMF